MDMTTSGLNNTKNTYNCNDIVQLEGETKEEWIKRMPKWSRQYRREYAKLYYRIYLKKIYTSQDLDLYNKMGKKNPQTRPNPNDTSKPKKLYTPNNLISFKVEKKKVKIDFKD
jgi:hypothetical protein